ncbi:MAG: protein kinase [Planctomycetales bacterium]|nr:protein kinase [Planctomycetales bacterium]
MTSLETSLEFTLPPAESVLRGEVEVDRLSREFEREWRRSEFRPLVADWIAKCSEGNRAELRSELVAVEIELRLGSGEAATADEYLDRFPDLGEWITELFANPPADLAGAVTRQGLPFIPTRLGDYRIVREIGRGGMGVVYEAVQESLGRRVAIKCLSASPFLTERHLKRFRQEACAIAKLHHSHIVEVYGLAEQHGLHYFAMQYIDGCGLDSVIGGNRPRTTTEAADELKSSDTVRCGSSAAVRRRSDVRRGSPDPAGTVSMTSGRPAVDDCAGSGDPRTTPVPQPAISSHEVANFPRVAVLRDFHDSERISLIARIIRQIAGALHYAHSRGVLHRDAKPSNILLDRDGNAWLSDFGLAKIVSDSNPLSDSEDVVGTLRYMAPEMLDRVSDARTDVYILGLTLYELLTFQPAFPETDRSRLMYQVLDSSPVPPRELNPAIPADLETIVLKALSREADGRYQSAADFANDLRRFTEQRPILARRVTLTRRFTRWCQREPILSSLAVGFMFLLASGLLSVTLQWRNAVRTQNYLLTQRDVAIRSQWDADKALRQAESSRREAESSRDELARSRIDADVAGGEARRHEEAALTNLVQFHRVMGAEALDDGDIGRALLWTMQAVHQAEVLESRRDEALDESLSNGSLPVADALRLRIRSLVDAMPRPLLMACSREILADDAAAPDLVQLGDRPPIGQTFFSEDGDQVWVTNGRGNRVLRWNLSTGKPDPVAMPRRFRAHELPVARSVALVVDDRGESSANRPQFCSTASGCWAVVAPDRERLELWHVASGTLEQTLTLPQMPDVVTGFFPDSDDLAVPEISEYPATVNDRELHQVWLSPRRDTLLTAFRADGELWLWMWNVRTGIASNVEPVRVSPRELQRVEFSHDGGRVALIGKQSVQIFDAARFDPLIVQEVPREAVVEFSPDGRWLALANEHEVNLWDVNSGRRLPEPFPIRLRGKIRLLRFDASGYRLLAVDRGGAWEMLNTTDGTHRGPPNRTLHNGIRHAKISPDGRLVAFGYQSGSVRVWSVRGGQPVTPPLQLLDPLASLAWSADGSRIAVLTDKGLLTVWDLAGLIPDRLLARGDSRPISRVRFSPDGSRLLVANDQDRMRQWNVNDDVPFGEPFDVPGSPHELIWSRNGTTLAAVTGDSSTLSAGDHHPLRLHVWSADSQQLLGLLDLSLVVAAASSPLPVPPDSDNQSINVAQLAAGLAAWQLAPGGLRLELRHPNGSTLVAATVNGNRLAHVPSPGQVALVSNSGHELRRCSMPDGRRITWLGFNPTGRVLAAASTHQFRAWDADSGRVLTTGLPIAETRVVAGVFRNDGRALLLVTDDEECQVWDTDTWQPLGPSFRLRGPHVLADFVADGQFVVTVSKFGMVRVWDWSRGEPITLGLRSQSPITAADLSPEGTQLVVAGNDGSLRVVDLPVEMSELAPGLDVLVSLLSGSRIDHEHGLVFPLSPDDLCEAWSRLRASRTDLVTPSDDARQLWHLRQLDEAGLEQDLAAQLFHLEHISPK